MKTDSLFYRLFHTLPELFFTLTGFEYAPLNYEFKAIEVKQTAFRLDGVFLPLVKNSVLPTIFVEVQFQADNTFYGRFFSEIFLYLHQYPQTNPCKAVVIYPDRNIETDNIQRYADLINISNIQHIYLKESLNKNSAHWQLDLLKLIMALVTLA
jgi:predicted transposase/invertase (TIGR01784 family)